MRNFAGRLKSLREQAGLSQQQLAEKAGISQRAISYYETGTEPPWSAVIALADALGVSCEEFRRPTGSKPPTCLA